MVIDDFTHTQIKTKPIRKTYCKNCPSRHPPDPEQAEYMGYPKRIRISDYCIFLCAWDNKHLCFGNTKRMIKGKKCS